MQEQSRYAVGIDVGTTTVRCVVGYIDSSTEMPKIVGVGQAPNSGMRKGVVTRLEGPASAIDVALGEAERMSGHQVERAVLSINGQHIVSTKSDGMIAIGANDHEVTQEDIARLDDVAVIGKLPANREVLDIVAHAYRLDGQDNIKNPVGMTGTRLEIHANIVSGLTPHILNVQKSAEMTKVATQSLMPAVLAGAQAVLTESQMENGVAVIDLGGSTTGVAIFEEGDLQYVAVIPLGGNNVTNDLAIGLKVDPEIAEQVKLAHARLTRDDKTEKAEISHDKQQMTFQQSEIDEIVEARFEEIFEAIGKELKKANRAGKLPSGVVLIGGGANTRGLVDYARDRLGVAVKIGKPSGYAGVSEQAEVPEYAVAVGLMLSSGLGDDRSAGGRGVSTDFVQKTGGFISKLFSKFH